MERTDPRRALGAAGERLAAAHLEARGFRLLDRNYRTRYGELDLVAADERYLVFCEVKARVARSAAGPARPARVGRLAQAPPPALDGARVAGRRADGGPHPPELRFDAIGITLDPAGALLALEHVEEAF